MSLLQFFLLVTWTPPFFGMIFLAILGFGVGLLTPLSEALKKIPGIGPMFMCATLFLGISLWIFPSLALYIIPVGLAWAGFALGLYYRAKTLAENEDEDAESGE